MGSSCCHHMEPAASSLWGPSKYLTSSPCTTPQFIIRSPELLQSLISSNCDLALGHGVKLICRPAGDSRCPLHLRKVACGFVYSCCQGMLWHRDAFRGAGRGLASLVSSVHSPVGWQGVTATSECLGITPGMKLPLPAWPQGCWCTGERGTGNSLL